MVDPVLTPSADPVQLSQRLIQAAVRHLKDDLRKLEALSARAGSSTDFRQLRELGDSITSYGQDIVGAAEAAEDEKEAALSLESICHSMVDSSPVSPPAKT